MALSASTRAKPRIHPTRNEKTVAFGANSPFPRLARCHDEIARRYASQYGRHGSESERKEPNSASFWFSRQFGGVDGGEGKSRRGRGGFFGLLVPQVTKSQPLG
jgi:hypothetical protein